MSTAPIKHDSDGPNIGSQSLKRLRRRLDHLLRTRSGMDENAAHEHEINHVQREIQRIERERSANPREVVLDLCDDQIEWYGMQRDASGKKYRLFYTLALIPWRTYACLGCLANTSFRSTRNGAYDFSGTVSDVGSRIKRAERCFALEGRLYQICPYM